MECERPRAFPWPGPGRKSRGIHQLSSGNRRLGGPPELPSPKRVDGELGSFMRGKTEISN